MSRSRLLLALAVIAGLGLVAGLYVGGQGAPPVGDADAVAAPPADAPPFEGTVVVPPGTRARFQAVLDTARAEGLAGRDLGVVMQRVGTMFRGAPYLDGTLDAPALADTSAGADAGAERAPMRAAKRSSCASTASTA